MKYDWRTDDVERRIIELTGWDPNHQGTYGLIWFPHAYRTEAYDPIKGPWRFVCLSCGEHGEWMSKIAADWDGDNHPQHAQFGGKDYVTPVQDRRTKNQEGRKRRLFRLVQFLRRLNHESHQDQST